MLAKSLALCVHTKSKFGSFESFLRAFRKTREQKFNKNIFICTSSMIATERLLKIYFIFKINCCLIIYLPWVHLSFFTDHRLSFSSFTLPEYRKEYPQREKVFSNIDVISVLLWSQQISPVIYNIITYRSFFSQHCDSKTNGNPSDFNFLWIS